VEFGKSKVMCAIYGPQEKIARGRLEFSPIGSVDCYVEFAPFAKQARVSRTFDTIKFQDAIGDTLQKSLESAIFLSNYPKTVIEVHIMVLESSFSDEEAITFASSLALADAGIEMCDLPVCISVSSVVGDDNRLIVDVSEEDLGLVDARVLCVVLPVSGRISKMSGSLTSPEKMASMMQLARDAGLSLREEMRKSLFESRKKTMLNPQ
jgi:exosome complex component RRP41